MERNPTDLLLPALPSQAAPLPPPTPQHDQTSLHASNHSVHTNVNDNHVIPMLATSILGRMTVANGQQ
jgi:hypothetical protein